jgi:hypothetical protein
MRTELVFITAAFAVALAGTPASGELCGPSDDPCVVSSSMTVPGGSSFELAGRALIIAAGQTLTVLDDGVLTITAGSLTLEPNAKITAPGTGGYDGYGGQVTITTSGPDGISMRPGSAMDVSRGQRGKHSSQREERRCLPVWSAAGECDRP